MEEVKVEMHPVVQLVVKRLESHPTEYKKWQAELDKFSRHLNKEEKAAVGLAMRNAVLNDAHKTVMKVLLAEPEPPKTRDIRYVALSPAPAVTTSTPAFPIWDGSTWGVLK